MRPPTATTTTMGRPARHLTPLDLDALALDLLPPGERELLLGHVAGCPTCRAASDQRERLVRHFQETVLTRSLATLRRTGARPAAPGGRGWLASRRWTLGFGALVAPLLAAAALALWWKPADEARPAPEARAGVRAKGGSLQVFAQRDGQVFAVSEGTVLTEGDAIRFLVDPGGLGHVIIGSVDGAGKANIYYPYEGSQSMPLAPDRRLEVPGSIILDQAPGPERLFAIFSPKPLATAEVRAALAALGALGPEAIRATPELSLLVGQPLGQASLLFEKEGP